MDDDALLGAQLQAAAAELLPRPPSAAGADARDAAANVELDALRLLKSASNPYARQSAAALLAAGGRPAPAHRALQMPLPPPSPLNLASPIAGNSPLPPPPHASSIRLVRLSDSDPPASSAAPPSLPVPQLRADTMPDERLYASNPLDVPRTPSPRALRTPPPAATAHPPPHTSPPSFASSHNPASPRTARFGTGAPAPGTRRPHSPTPALRTKSPIVDDAFKGVWLNPLGQKVVGGHVVGTLSLAPHRSRPASPQPHATVSLFPHRSASPSLPSDTSAADKPGQPVDQAAYAPAFFTSTFPRAIPGRRGSLDLSSPRASRHAPSPDKHANDEEAASMPPAPLPVSASGSSASGAAALAPEPSATLLLPSTDASQRDARSAPTTPHLGRSRSNTPVPAPLDPPLTDLPPLVTDSAQPARLTSHALAQAQRTTQGVDSPSRRSSLSSAASSLVSLPVSVVTVASEGPLAGPRRRPAKWATWFAGVGASLFGTPSVPSAAAVAAAPAPPGRVFSHEVRIRGWSEVGGRVGGFVVYHIVIVLKTGAEVELYRRYSSFVRLRQALATERPDVAQTRTHGRLRLPPLPPKHPLHKYAATYLEARRRALQTWLNTVMLDPVWASCACLQEWIVDAG